MTQLAGVEVLYIELRAPVASFRNPLYAGVQVGLPCPPPATVGGLLAAACGGWEQVPIDLRFGMAFTASGTGTDLETYHPLLTTGRKGDPTPENRPFLFDTVLRIWVFGDVERWEHALRRPVWPLRLGRSQDLATARTRRARLQPGTGNQGYSVVPAGLSNFGTLLQLPTAVSYNRSRTRWDPYRYHPAGGNAEIDSEWASENGDAVVVLPPVHPDQFNHYE